MDGHRFDTLVRTLAHTLVSSAPSRRTFVRRLGAGTLGGMLARLGLASPAAAGGRKLGEQCVRDNQCFSGFCALNGVCSCRSKTPKRCKATGFCCREDEACCPDRRGRLCCPKELPVCCRGKAKAACCEKQHNCCPVGSQRACCPRRDNPVCCKKGSKAACCDVSTVCCPPSANAPCCPVGAPVCCPPGSEVGCCGKDTRCCPAGSEEPCCPPGATCCPAGSAESCCPAGTRCTPQGCEPDPPPCPPGAQSTQGCPPGADSCAGSGVVPCGAGTGCECHQDVNGCSFCASFFSCTAVCESNADCDAIGGVFAGATCIRCPLVCGSAGACAVPCLSAG